MEHILPTGRQIEHLCPGGMYWVKWTGNNDYLRPLKAMYYKGRLCMYLAPSNGAAEVLVHGEIEVLGKNYSFELLKGQMYACRT